MRQLAVRLWCKDEGQGLAEYVLILVLIALVAVISVKEVAVTVGEAYSEVTNKIEGVYAPSESDSEGNKTSSHMAGPSQSGLGGPGQGQNYPGNNVPGNGLR